MLPAVPVCTVKSAADGVADAGAGAGVYDVVFLFYVEPTLSSTRAKKVMGEFGIVHAMSLEDLRTAMTKLDSDIDKESLMAAFGHFDAMQTGTISGEELRAILGAWKPCLYTHVLSQQVRTLSPFRCTWDVHLCARAGTTTDAGYPAASTIIYYLRRSNSMDRFHY